MDVRAADLDEEGIGLQAAPMTTGALERRTVPAEQDAHMQLIAFALEIFEKVVDPVERFVTRPQQCLGVAVQQLVGTRQVHAVSLHRQQHLFLPPVGAGFAPRLDGALCQGLVVVGDHQRRIVTQHIAEAFTFGTGSQRMIERKQNRPKGFEGPPAALATKAGMIPVQSLTDYLNGAAAFSFPKRRFNRLAETRPVVFSNDETIEDDVQGWLVVK